jgi:hypothetical protein
MNSIHREFLPGEHRAAITSPRDVRSQALQVL